MILVWKKDRLLRLEHEEHNQTFTTSNFTSAISSSSKELVFQSSFTKQNIKEVDKTKLTNGGRSKHNVVQPLT
jgi:hypothetical protein